MHGWDGCTHLQPRKTVYGYGKKIKDGCGPRGIFGPTCGGTEQGIGSI